MPRCGGRHGDLWPRGEWSLPGQVTRPVMVVQPGEEPRLLESRNLILGVFPDPMDMGSTLDVELRPKDRIILYTDGITDVFDSRGKSSASKACRDSCSRLPSCHSVK